MEAAVVGPVLESVKESWDILKRAEACSACTREFSPGETTCTRLAASGPALARTDFCAACWASVPEDPASIFWRSRVPEPKEKKQDLFDAPELFRILTRLLEEGTPGQERLCYLLALFCSRKRLLRLQGIERKDGVETLVFVTPRTHKLVRIRSVDLTAEDMTAAREELSKMAEGQA